MRNKIDELKSVQEKSGFDNYDSKKWVLINRVVELFDDEDEDEAIRIFELIHAMFDGGWDDEDIDMLFGALKD